MQWLGTRFSTWMEPLGGVAHVWKSMDYAPGREPSACWREWLGARLGARIALAVPATRLLVHPRYGRVSVQRLIPGARPVTVPELRALATNDTGWRILLLDLVIRNPDRRPANLLRTPETVMPIDFNVAFEDLHVAPDDAAWRLQIMQWVGLDGLCALRPCDRERMLAEARRTAGLLSDAYLAWCARGIDARFLGPADAGVLCDGLRQRRQALEPTLMRWWDESVLPLHRLVETEGEDGH